jgi:hypothetical protein
MRTLQGLFLTVLAALGAPSAASATDLSSTIYGPDPTLREALFVSSSSLNGSWSETSPLPRREIEISTISPSGAAVSLVRLSRTDTTGTPVFYGPQPVEVSYVRGWPSAFKVSRGGYDLDISPHAGFGFSTGGGQMAEAGAMVRLGMNLRDRVIDGLNGLGVRSLGPAPRGDKGRWYLFAAASDQSLTLSPHDGFGDFRRLGLASDAANTLVSNAQAGVAWSKGDVQAAFGYVHRQVSVLGVAASPMAQQAFSGSMMAFSISLRGH